MAQDIMKKADNFLDLSEEKIDLLKRTVCKGATDDELQLFLHVCNRTGLDPFMRQIYSVARGSQRTIQTGIDGYRLIAERTGKYMPGREPSFAYTEKGELISATAYIKKMASDGTWHEVSASVFFSEYNPGNNPMWKKMPHLMLAKCAETLVIRKSFPADLSGIYTEDETFHDDLTIETDKPEYISIEQANQLNLLLKDCRPSVKENFMKFLGKLDHPAGNINLIRKEDFAKVHELLKARREKDMQTKKSQIIEVDSSFDVEEIEREMAKSAGVEHEL